MSNTRFSNRAQLIRIEARLAGARQNRNRSVQLVFEVVAPLR
jgi:hypothetical protein